MILTSEEKSAFKLAQLLAVPCSSGIQVFEKILAQDGDINFEIPLDSPYKDTKSYMLGFTALHYSYTIHNIKLFDCLLTHGADFTKLNNEGRTVIHMAIRNQSFGKPLNNSFIDAVLSAHMNTNNSFNPRNNDGLSHFHVACMTRHSAAVQFFLDNGISIDEPVSKDSKFLPGFTPLHLAVMCSNTIIVEVLLANGADMHMKNARDMTPLHFLMEQKLEMNDSIGSALCRGEDFHKKLEIQIVENEKLISMLLENTSSDNDSMDSIGLNNFHVACTLKDTTAAENLVDRVAILDHCVNMNSHLWPGYTALHFAAHFSIKVVEMLMDNGANIEAKDSRGLTPLDICMERYKLKDILSIESLSAKYDNLMFSDGRTKVLTLIQQMTDSNRFEKFSSKMQDINTRIPPESPLWPGFTPLHLAVLCAASFKRHSLEDRGARIRVDDQIIQQCFSLGADLSVQDTRGRTALHLAFRLKKECAIDTIFRHCGRIPDVADEENLTHLHIVCSTQTMRLEQCILSKSAVNAVYRGTTPIRNVRPGATPLHVCLTRSNSRFEFDFKTAIRGLLASGADVHVKDADGLTPIHRLLESTAWHNSKATVTQMMMKVSNDCVVDKFKLSYMHVASRVGNQAAMKRLIKKRANVNLAIEYTGKRGDESVGFLSNYHKCTPLHMTGIDSSKTDKLLIDLGADVFAVNAEGTTALGCGPSILDHFLSVVKGSNELQERVKRDYGWTRLHVLCYLLKFQGFERSIAGELEDINAQTHGNSPFWKGYTPLHLLIYRGVGDYNYFIAPDMLKTLLDSGADVTVMDHKRNTPITMMFDYFRNGLGHVALLLKYHRDFKVNPIGAQGISHFHIACYLNDLKAVKGFLSCGVDVNRPIDYFGSWCPGYTPLHLASEFPVVDLLISHGADVHAEDVSSCSVLAEAMRRDFFDGDVNIVAEIIEKGANVNAVNVSGQTPFEMALSSGRMTMEKLKFCIERGFHVNSCNPISGRSYIATILKNYIYEDRELQRKLVETIANENPTVVLGRSTLHHIVTGTSGNILIEDYVSLFEKLIKSGCDLDAQDDKGSTALQLAATFANEKAVVGLLACGADINIINVNGNAPSTLAYTQSAFHHYCERVRNLLAVHAFKLAYLKLDLSKINEDAIPSTTLHNYADNSSFCKQVAVAGSYKVGVRSMSLGDFLSETKVIAIYPKLVEADRSKIEEFFETVDRDDTFSEIKGILKLQYRKAMKRAELLSSATSPLRSLLGFALPDLCVDNIFQYLHNSDLKNIISAEIGRNDMRMDVE